MSEANKEVVRRHYEDGMNNGDIGVATAAFAPEYVNHIPGQAEPLRGNPGLGGVLPGAEGRLPRHDHHPRHLLGEGDLVAVRHIWRGTHEGDYEGIAPTGRQVTFTGADIYRIVDGKIVEEWPEFDELGILRQLGADVGAPSPSGTE